MKNSVVLKSFPNGIVLHLDPEMPFETLIIDIADKFHESCKDGAFHQGADIN